MISVKFDGEIRNVSNFQIHKVNERFLQKLHIQWNIRFSHFLLWISFASKYASKYGDEDSAAGSWYDQVSYCEAKYIRK